MNCAKEEFLLYALTDRTWLKKETLSSQVEKALKGGVTLLQLREKTLNEEEFLREAKEIKCLCDRYGVPLIINDNIKIAQIVGAAGVHLGQDDMDLDTARARLGSGKIIGVSARTLEQAVSAERAGADYLGVGAVFSTETKRDAKMISKQTLHEICATVSIPVVAVGGITGDNLCLLKDSGIDGIAVISAIFAQEDIESAARSLRRCMEENIKCERQH